MAATPPERHVVRLVVPSADGRRVLGRPNGLAGWALPTIVVPTPRVWLHAHDAAARAVLGGAVSPVRHVTDEVWQVELCDRLPAAGVTWIAPADAERLGADAGVVRAWAGHDPATDPPHLRPGWRDDFRRWVDGHLEPTGPGHCIQHWELSSVHLVPTASGDLVAKHAGPGFELEGRITAALDGLPGAPSVVVEDGARFVVRHAGTPADRSLRVPVARAHGRLQRAAIDRLDAVAGAGARDAASVLRGDTAAHELLERVGALDLPTSIVHTDAHPGNAVVAGDHITLIDWSDAVLGSPALDLDLLCGHSGTTDAAPVVRAWAEGFSTDPEPVLRAMPDVRRAAAAVAVALHREHRPHLPDAFLGWWDDAIDYWERRLADLAD